MSYTTLLTALELPSRLAPPLSAPLDGHVRHPLAAGMLVATPPSASSRRPELTAAGQPPLPGEAQDASTAPA